MLKDICKVWSRLCESKKIINLLPQIYIPYREVVPNGHQQKEIRVNMQRIIKNAGSFPCLEIERKKNLNDAKWYNAWLILQYLSYGW